MEILSERIEKLENKLYDVSDERISHIEVRLDKVVKEIAKTNKQGRKNRKLLASLKPSPISPLESNERQVYLINTYFLINFK